MNRPSGKATQAAQAAIDLATGGALTEDELTFYTDTPLAAAHDPVLGLDASVRLGDVVEGIERIAALSKGMGRTAPEEWIAIQAVADAVRDCFKAGEL